MTFTPFYGHLDRGPPGSARRGCLHVEFAKEEELHPGLPSRGSHLVIDTGRRIVQVAREIGVGEALLGRWVAVERARTDPPEALDVDERAELARLQPRTLSCGWTGSSRKRRLDSG